MEYKGESGAAAALSVQARIHPANPLVEPRALVSQVSNWRKTKGYCPWCNEPGDGPEPGWHHECKKYYYAARGATHFEMHGKRVPLIPKTPCIKCEGPSQEIDHIMALATARTKNEADSLKAWTPQNLQWLCRRCHSEKTARDVRSNRTPRVKTKSTQLDINRLPNTANTH